MSDEAKANAGPYGDIAPALNEYTRDVLFGRVWEGAALSKRDRSLITVAALVALYANTAVEIARKVFGKTA